MGVYSSTPLSGVSVHTGVGVIVCSCERVVSGTSNQRTSKGKGSTLFCVVIVLFGADRNKKLLPTRIRDTIMKRQVLLLAALLLLSASVFAQDIIITRDAQRIESKIKEVSPTEIRYLFWDDQDGPVFVLPTSDIVTVIYQNGRVQVFNHDKPAAANEETKSPSDTTDVSGGVIELSGSRLAPFFILKQGDKETTMNGSELIKFLNTACPAAYNEYIKGFRIYAGGYIMVCCGLGLVIAGALCMDSSVTAGACLLGTGCAASIASVAMAYTGKHKAVNSYKIYNVQCQKQVTTLSLNGQISQDGIGLALRF